MVHSRTLLIKNMFLFFGWLKVANMCAWCALARFGPIPSVDLVCELIEVEGWHTGIDFLGTKHVDEYKNRTGSQKLIS
jgi:phosphoribosylformimino-5-aminoimidazole carboxamide ribonucleotide (ProFAR) isomerase